LIQIVLEVVLRGHVLPLEFGQLLLEEVLVEALFPQQQHHILHRVHPVLDQVGEHYVAQQRDLLRSQAVRTNVYPVLLQDCLDFAPQVKVLILL